MRVAIVRNRSRQGVINRFGQSCPETYAAKTIDMVAAALRAGSHTAVEFEGDKTLLGALEAFMPADAEGQPGGLVFNMAYGIGAIGPRHCNG